MTFFAAQKWDIWTRHSNIKCFLPCPLGKPSYVTVVVFLWPNDVSQSNCIGLIFQLSCSEGYFINHALDIFSAWITGHRGKSFYVVAK